jgi:hypothetical protein
VTPAALVTPSSPIYQRISQNFVQHLMAAKVACHYWFAVSLATVVDHDFAAS